MVSCILDKAQRLSAAADYRIQPFSKMFRLGLSGNMFLRSMPRPAGDSYFFPGTARRPA